MDPVVELASVAASYLWTWRELFPDAKRLTSATPLSAEIVTMRYGFGYHRAGATGTGESGNGRTGHID